jgi:hypothetical protein
VLLQRSGFVGGMLAMMQNMAPSNSISGNHIR